MRDFLAFKADRVEEPLHHYLWTSPSGRVVRVVSTGRSWETFDADIILVSRTARGLIRQLEKEVP